MLATERQKSFRAGKVMERCSAQQPNHPDRQRVSRESPPKAASKAPKIPSSCLEANAMRSAKPQPRHLGFEGVVSTRLGSPYVAGRSRHGSKARIRRHRRSSVKRRRIEQAELFTQPAGDTRDTQAASLV